MKFVVKSIADWGISIDKFIDITEYVVNVSKIIEKV